MEIQIKRNDIYFLGICLGLGILAELSFFHGMIGVSYLVFITGFYAVFFLRFRSFLFTHRRIGLLLMIVIWLLSASYLVYDNAMFYQLNLMVIPFLVSCHLVLVTSPKNMQWHRPIFLLTVMDRIARGLTYNKRFFGKAFKHIFKNMDETTAQTIKRILIGLAIGLPLLGFVTILLMSADAVFEGMVQRLPWFLLQLNFSEQLWRMIAVVFFLFLFFGIFQGLAAQKEPGKPRSKKLLKKPLDSVIALTILLLLNGVYVLFTVIQFTYFFGSGLQEGYTYAEYARRGFFELIIVTLLNWSLLTSFLTFVKEERTKMRITLKVMYSLLIIVSSVMLSSAYQRLSLYEEAYGFTLDRILAHSFMIFLFVIFAYTLIRVWIEKLSLLHFYLIASLLFYAGLNVVPLNKIIVENNMDRYQETGKIDIDYLNALSAVGINGLVRLYEQNPDNGYLEQIIMNRQNAAERKDDNWQSYNITRHEVEERLRGLDVE